MQSQSYYAKRPLGDNSCDNSSPLILNCAGYQYSTKKFTCESSRHDYYLQFVDMGSLTLGNGEVMGTESFIIRPPERPYKYINDGSALGYYWIHFTGSHAESLLSTLGLELDRVYTIPSSVNTDHIKHDFTTVFNELMLRRGSFDEMCAAKLHALLTRFSRVIESASGRGSAAANTMRIARALNLIQRRYTEKITINELAKEEHLSPSRFRELFRAALGTSPVEYITSLRVTRACELLGTTDLSVTEIAQICGFDDEPYFCRVFRKSMGTSPLEYRKSV